MRGGTEGEQFESGGYQKIRKREGNEEKKEK